VKSAVFFERDGILNNCPVVRQHQVQPLRLEQFKVNEEARPQLQALKDAGFLIIVATNQPEVSAGRLSRNELDLMHVMLRRKLPVDDILVCPYDDSDHPCCKPQPGLFMEAAFKWSVDLERSYVVSDKWQDAKAAQVAGCTSVMIRSPWSGQDHHDFLVADLEAATRKILRLLGSNQSCFAAHA
jgi:D-glycero-D-manno-heptose 1,7-bisphosphate phosphatase